MRQFAALVTARFPHGPTQGSAHGRQEAYQAGEELDPLRRREFRPGAAGIDAHPHLLPVACRQDHRRRLGLYRNR